MAGRGARSDRGNVRGALVDEFTHVITGGATRACVLKQSSTVLRRCSARCRRWEADRHGGRGCGTGCLFGRMRHRSPQVRTAQRTAPEPALGSGQTRYRHAAQARRSVRSRSGTSVALRDDRWPQPSREIRLIGSSGGEDRLLADTVYNSRSERLATVRSTGSVTLRDS